MPKEIWSRRMCQVFATDQNRARRARAALVLHRTMAPKKEGQQCERCSLCAHRRKFSDFGIGATARSLNGRAKARCKIRTGAPSSESLYRNTGSHMIAAGSWISVWRKIQQPRQLIIRTHHTSLCPALLVRRADQANAFQQQGNQLTLPLYAKLLEKVLQMGSRSGTPDAKQSAAFV